MLHNAGSPGRPMRSVTPGSQSHKNAISRPPIAFFAWTRSACVPCRRPGSPPWWAGSGQRDRGPRTRFWGFVYRDRSPVCRGGRRRL